jgi:hypothetical protein
MRNNYQEKKPDSDVCGAIESIDSTDLSNEELESPKYSSSSIEFDEFS